MGVNICASGVVVGRSKRDRGGIRGILFVRLRALSNYSLLT